MKQPRKVAREPWLQTGQARLGARRSRCRGVAREPRVPVGQADWGRPPQPPTGLLLTGEAVSQASPRTSASDGASPSGSPGHSSRTALNVSACDGQTKLLNPCSICGLPKHQDFGDDVRKSGRAHRTPEIHDVNATKCANIQPRHVQSILTYRKKSVAQLAAMLELPSPDRERFSPAERLVPHTLELGRLNPPLPAHTGCPRMGS